MAIADRVIKLLITNEILFRHKTDLPKLIQRHRTVLCVSNALYRQVCDNDVVREWLHEIRSPDCKVVVRRQIFVGE